MHNISIVFEIGESQDANSRFLKKTMVKKTILQKNQAKRWRYPPKKYLRWKNSLKIHLSMNLHFIPVVRLTSLNKLFIWLIKLLYPLTVNKSISVWKVPESYVNICRWSFTVLMSIWIWSVHNGILFSNHSRTNRRGRIYWGRPRSKIYAKSSVRKWLKKIPPILTIYLERN